MSVEVVFYREDDGSVPIELWLAELPAKVRAKCLAKLARLEDLGHELRRPEADFLRDGIYELRVSRQGIQYRILYFFNGKAFIVLSHGLVKEGAQVPPIEIERAIERKKKFEEDPKKHSHPKED